MTPFLVILALAMLGAGASVVYRAGRWIVPAGHVGVVRRVRGPAYGDPRFRRVTPYNSRGIHAVTLPPERPRWLFPGLYTVEYVPRVDIPEGSLGLVTALEGKRRPAGQRLGMPVPCDDFQDGRTFLLNGGEQGRQAATLPGDASYYINTMLFEVEVVPRTYVPSGTVGLVLAAAGKVRAPGRPFGRHVECDDFQDGAAFLRAGGEQGRQLAVLAGGTYYDINPSLFEVITTDDPGVRADEATARQLREIDVPVGYTGVVITLDGEEPAEEEKVGPRIAGHRNYRLPWVFLEHGGRRGVQGETLKEGTVYALNPWFVRVMLVPTYVLNMEWSKKDSAMKGNYDAKLEQIDVTIQGIRLQVDLSQTLRIPPAVAPTLVSEFGSTLSADAGGGLVDDPLPVQRFVDRVLGATVATYFSEIAAGATVKEFLSGYLEIRTDLAAQVRNALKGWGVEAVRTNLGEFESQDSDFYTHRKEAFAMEARGDVLAIEERNVDREVAIDKKRMEGERLRLIMALQAEIDVFGQENAVVMRMIREMSNLPVPEVISGDVSQYLQSMPLQMVRDLLLRVRRARADDPLTEGGAAAREVVESVTQELPE
ncbi:SPFH domain-containing protein [Spongiactinospora sp. TRM90649]|uniref:SPFH domain-containing protein n=1 Tax=Spongiactinospora sp. TRM90649 TaxID=3031114 RepID=UPI0023F83A3B|nr:SPFH domain-containing protein [Spongiactinospora sp. TRM90649]MDF5754524.1 SPFH domain-containing protein [Spongiactinospora sp. TRM90649]